MNRHFTKENIQTENKLVKSSSTLWRGGWEGLERKEYQQKEELFWAVGFVHYLVCSVDFMGIYRCQNLANCTLEICADYMSIILQ